MIGRSASGEVAKETGERSRTAEAGPYKDRWLDADGDGEMPRPSSKPQVMLTPSGSGLVAHKSFLTVAAGGELGGERGET